METAYDWEVATHDVNRTAWEKFFYPYPITLADFDDAEREGIFIGRLPSLVMITLAWAVVLTLMRSVFNK
jgi:hypothetical protein